MIPLRGQRPELSVSRYVMKDTKDTRKHSSPKVSVRGQRARCVNCHDSVSGRAMATAATYTHPAKQ